MNKIGDLQGPQATMERMRTIQNKLDSVFGSTLNGEIAASSGKLEGAIGGSKPLDPFGKGISLCAGASPEIKAMISQAAKQNGVDEDLFDALVSTESAYNPGARSHAGALGLCQLMPGTAQALGVENAMDPAQNLNGGAKYLSQLLKQFGDTSLALAAYNAGPNAVIRAGNQVPPYRETENYVNKIMSLVNAKKSS